MCGRFYVPPQAVDLAVSGLPRDQQEAARQAIADWVADMNRPRNDVRPTNQYPVLTNTSVAPMRWGFKTDKSNAVFNARQESLRYPIWRESLVLRRAVVPVGGFYEWTGAKGSKQAHAIARADGQPMLFAALWQEDAELGPCFSIITTAATAWMKPLHERMPVILEASQIATWLDLSSPPAEIKAMLVPGPAALTEFACQAPRNDQPPRPEQPSLF